MEKSILVLKSLLIPKLEKDINFHRLNFKDAYWEMFTESFLNFENDAKPIYELIYGLQLNDPERIFDKLPNIFSEFMNELAENLVLGNYDRATTYLARIKNQTFLERVSFLQTMQQAIKKVERENIKINLPKSYERLTFELSDVEMTRVTSKVGRDDLKSKFKEWDKELKQEKEPVIFYSIRNEKKTEPQRKVISLSWLKYAVAACLILAGGIWVFKYSNPAIIQPDNGIVNTEKDTTTVDNNIPIEAVAYNTKVSEKVVQYPSDLGFTNSTNSKKITIYLKDASQRIVKIKNELATERNGVAGDGPKYKALKKQLDLLVSQQGNYEFDGKHLIIYTNDLKLFCSVLSLDDKTYYLKMDSHYYHLYLTKLPLKFKLLKEAELIEQLEKTSFENEE